MGTEEARTRRLLAISVAVGIIIPLVMSAGTALYLYREAAEIRSIAKVNEAKIVLNIDTIKALREQIIRVEEEQKRRSQPVGRIDTIERRLEKLEGRMGRAK